METPLASALRGIDRLHAWESFAIPAAHETLTACKRGCRRKPADLRCNDCHAARLEIARVRGMTAAAVTRFELAAIETWILAFPS